MFDKLFEEYKHLPKKLLDEVREESELNRLKSDEVKKVLKRIEKEYNSAQITSGEAIGIITAESFGEPGTQMILRSFHFAGVSELTLTSGLARLIELFDARKIPSTPTSTIYLTSDYNKDPNKAKQVAVSIKQTTMDEITEEFVCNLTQQRVEVILDKKKMRDLKITENYLEKTLSEKLKKVKVKQSGDKIIIKPDGKEIALSDVYQVKEKIKELSIKGIKGVNQVLPIKQANGEFVIFCDGEDLGSISEIKGVDIKRSICNNPFVIAELFGIEAARNLIMDESTNVIKSQGLDIDVRHIMFLSDVMTNTGKIRGITRSGITSEKDSVLARASFETPIKHIINASLIGEQDNLTSVIENVILNQAVPLGTGLPNLVAKMKDGAFKSKKK
ncbi:DNA-directed RNA polymerase subunit A'' [archaeon]|nr:DNA-directed RNA polymerase subunit A'' [archaeon]